MIHDCNYVCFDVETTGLNYQKGAQICQISLFSFDQQLKDVSNYTTYVKMLKGELVKVTDEAKQTKIIKYNGVELQEKVIDQRALDYNGIKREQMEELGVSYEQLFNNLQKYFKALKKGTKKVILVGHNLAEFDIDFLEEVFTLHSDSIWNYATKFILDTMCLSRMKEGHIEVESHKLGDVCAREGVILVDAHDAKSDTIATKELAKSYISQLRTSSKSNSTDSVVKVNQYVRNFQF